MPAGRNRALIIVVLIGLAALVRWGRPALSGHASGGAGDDAGCGGGDAPTRPPMKVWQRAPVPVELVATGEAARATFQKLREAHHLPIEFAASTLTAVETDERSAIHARFQQVVNGVPVFGGEAIVHTGAAGAEATVTDRFVRNIRLDPTPGIARGDIVAKAVAELRDCTNCLVSEPLAELMYLRRNEDDRLVWRVRLDRSKDPVPSLPVQFVDADTGDIVLEYDDFQTYPGVALYEGNVDINVLHRTFGEYLEDHTRHFAVLDARNTGGTSELSEEVVGGSAWRLSDASDVWDKDPAAVQASWAVAKVLDYYRLKWGRNGIDGVGGPVSFPSQDGTSMLLPVIVHVGDHWNNAGWSPVDRLIKFGDGDGTRFSPFISLDAVGHEVTHGVVQATANLTYEGEPGALNESMADVFGMLVRRWVRGETEDYWVHGDQIYTPGTPGDALRSFRDPHQADNHGTSTDFDPCHYDERYTGTSDNGGVHENSGIANKAFFLLAQGGSHHLGGQMAGIGIDKAATIWWKALTSYMTSSTNFARARSATMASAVALYGVESPEHIAVMNAWGLVGVGAPHGSAELVPNGDFEDGDAYWALNTDFIHVIGRAAHGSGYVATEQTADFDIARVTVDIPAGRATANLTFATAITTQEIGKSGFADTLAVDVSEGSTMTTITTLGNGDASGLIWQQRGPFNLLPWAGKRITLRFIVKQNGTAPTVFRIDDVSVR